MSKTSTVQQNSFLRKNILTVVSVVTLISLLFFAPTYHFISENFEIFTSLAYENQPSLVPHLERELKWINFFFIAAITGFITFSALFFYQSLKSTLLPVERVSRHIDLLKVGQYYTAELSTSTEGFTQLSQVYTEFHRSLKNKTTEELSLLQKIETDERNRDSALALKKLIQLKKEQLGLIESNENVVSLNEYDRQRRAS